MANKSRASMVQSAASLISKHGASGTSLADVLAASRAPRGSMYHHFPSGKRQLLEDAVQLTADSVLAHMRATSAQTPREVLACFFAMWRHVVEVSGGRAGCAIAGVAVDTDADEQALMSVVRDAFRSWEALLSEQLVASGVAPAQAQALAITALSAMEGALILCRAEGGVAPLDTVAEQVMRLLD